MLSIKNLTKVFKTKNGILNTALNNISFDLPDKGLTFIVGKSGSGKTTLLSLIGGLESVTNGDIVLDGKNLTKLTHSELDHFRNHNIGFIFQDYHLIDSLTVFENIKLVLDFQDNNNDDLIYKSLEDVDLKGYENRYPNELSGGQKQRVAIARVIAKNPSLILADEPTGNLDINTTKQILELIKKLAKNRLIIFVSHNIFDAKQYADYLIYLSEGHIEGCYQKSSDNISTFNVHDDTLYLPLNKHITEEEKINLIEEINNNEVKNIIQYNDEYIPLNKQFNSNHSIDLSDKKHLKMTKSIKYGLKLFKGQRIKSTIFSLMTAIIISITGMFALLTNINKYNVIENYEYSKTNPNLVLHNKYETTGSDDFFSVSGEIPSNYKEVFERNGYNGEIYEAVFIGDRSRHSINTLSNVYYTSPYYLITTNEKFLSSIFENNNDLDYIVKKDVEEVDSFYITDYLADKYLLSQGYELNIANYKKMLNKKLSFYKFELCINGIINTHYRELYPEFLEQLDRKQMNNVKSILVSPKGEEFVNNLFNYYLNIYTYNEDGLRHYAENNKIKSYYLKSSNITYNGSNYSLEKIGKSSFLEYDDLKEKEVVIPISLYQVMFDDHLIINNYHRLENPIDIEFTQHMMNKSGPLKTTYNAKYKIVGVVNDQSLFFNDNDFIDIIAHMDYPNYLYFSDSSNIDAIKKGAHELNLIPTSVAEYQSYISQRYIETQNSLFSFFFVLLLIVVIILLIYYNRRILKDKIYEVGVMKSLGARDIDLINMLSVNVMETLIKTLVFFNIFEYFLVHKVDKFLYTAITEVYDFNFIPTPNLQYLILSSGFIFTINIIIIVFILLAFLIPFIKIRFLKPTNIIKAKE